MTLYRSDRKSFYCGSSSFRVLNHFGSSIAPEFLNVLIDLLHDLFTQNFYLFLFVHLFVGVENSRKFSDHCAFELVFRQKIVCQVDLLILRHIVFVEVAKEAGTSFLVLYFKLSQVLCDKIKVLLSFGIDSLLLLSLNLIIDKLQGLHADLKPFLTSAIFWAQRGLQTDCIVQMAFGLW